MFYKKSLSFYMIDGLTQAKKTIKSFEGDRFQLNRKELDELTVLR